MCELYVRAITAGMNELERLKLKTEKVCYYLYSYITYVGKRVIVNVTGCGFDSH